MWVTELALLYKKKVCEEKDLGVIVSKNIKVGLSGQCIMVASKGNQIWDLLIELCSMQK